MKFFRQEPLTRDIRDFLTLLENKGQLKRISGEVDSDLEIAVGGYSGSTSSNSLFVINYDGTDVDGFPYVVGEKIKAGAAVADMDGNGIDDIIFGTDSDNLHVILDSSVPAPNFPVSLSDRIQSEPAILDLNGENLPGWPVQIGNDVVGSVLFEDLNGDNIFSNDDTDADSIPNYRDRDDDGDGILTKDEYDEDGDGEADDTDGDGVPDYLDPDN